jgi:hypothetical protein
MTTEPTRPIEVFFCYAHKDEKLRENLEKHLSALKHSGLITTWHDREIQPGTDQALEIDKHLNTADIILLLVSSDFLHSNYCYGVEMKRAIERHKEKKAHVIPIILRPVDWEGTPIDGLVTLPKDAKSVKEKPITDLAFREVALGVRKVVNALLKVAQSDQNPVEEISQTSQPLARSAKNTEETNGTTQISLTRLPQVQSPIPSVDSSQLQQIQESTENAPDSNDSMKLPSLHSLPPKASPVTPPEQVPMSVKVKPHLSRSKLMKGLLGIVALIALVGTLVISHPWLPQPSGLEDDASQWGIFYVGGNALGRVDNVADPSIDDTALKISLVNGDPYTDVQAYRNLQPADAATTFDLSLSFYFPNVTPIHALEFTMSKWVNNQRWEWALQWENIGVGVPPSAWNLWNGSSWQKIGVTQVLSTNQWHMFHLKGDIIRGQVHYISFSCDGVSMNLGQIFLPVPSNGIKLAVGIQLDGDAHEDPYQVYIDKVDFRWD